MVDGKYIMFYSQTEFCESKIRRTRKSLHNNIITK